MDHIFNYGIADMPIITCLLIKGFVEFCQVLDQTFLVLVILWTSALLNDGFLVSLEPLQCGTLYLQFPVFLEFMPFLPRLTPSAVHLSESKVSCRVVDVLSTCPLSSELYCFSVLTWLYFV